MADLRVYDTYARDKRPFAPLDPANVRMYVCGPTVYDFAHIGNARPVIVFDVLFRLLRHLYGPEHVTYVRNVTDVDDKINARALERWTKQRPLTAEIRALTDTTLAQFHEDVDALGCLRPTHEPRATDYVCRPEPSALDMVAIIERLIAKGHAYEAQGHVLFHVPSMPAYGRLARRSRDEMLAGARVEVAPYKKDPTDFVLWKPSDPEREPGWNSPWGYGRPGWHIECSAMSAALLGETFDIHGGGIDLVFPHHENEIAQSCCAFDIAQMAQVWMHNGFLMVEGEKMSKSLGNFVTIRELLGTDRFGGREWPGEVLRLAMLKTHYRQPIDWTVKALEEAEDTLESWRRYASLADGSELPQTLIEALCDDVNTPQAIAEIHGLTRPRKGVIFGSREPGARPFWVPGRTPERAREIRGAVEVLGLAAILAPDWNAQRSLAADVDSSSVDSLIATRTAARKAKNWAESDRIRDELAAMGVTLKDGKDPTTGEPVTTWEIAR